MLNLLLPIDSLIHKAPLLAFTPDLYTWGPSYKDKPQSDNNQLGLIPENLKKNLPLFLLRME